MAGIKELRELFLRGIKDVPEESILQALAAIERDVITGDVSLDQPTNPKSGSTMLHSACFHGKFRVMEWLLEHKASSNVRDRRGVTPMHYLCQNTRRNGQRGALLVLAKFGGSTQTPDQSGHTPATVAQRENFDVNDFLKRNDIDGLNAAGGDVKQIAEQLEQADARLARLFANIAAPDSQDAAIKLLKSTPLALNVDATVPGHKASWHFLHAACVQSNVELVRLLLEKGANPNIQTAKGKTPLHLTVPHIEDSDSKRIVESLMRSGADMTITSFLRGQTALDMIGEEEDRQWIENLQRRIKHEKREQPKKSVRILDSKDDGMDGDEKDDRVLDNKFLDDLLLDSGFYDKKSDTKHASPLDRMLSASSGFVTKVQGNRSSAEDMLRKKLMRGKKKKSSNLIDELLGSALASKARKEQSSADDLLMAKLKKGKVRASVGLLDQILNADDTGDVFAGIRSSANDSFLAKLKKGKKKKSTNLLDQLLGDSDMGNILSGSQMDADALLRAKLARGKKRKPTALDKMMGDHAGMAKALAGSKMDADAMLKAKLARGKQAKKKEEEEVAEQLNEDSVEKTVIDIFHMVDLDGNGVLGVEERHGMMTVLGDKLWMNGDDLLNEADTTGSGDIDPEELVEWFKRRGTTAEELREIREKVRTGIQGAVERYIAAATLLKDIIDGNDDALSGVLSAGQADAAELLRYKLLKGKKKASKNMIECLMDGGDMKTFLSSSREDSNARLLEKLAKKRKEKQMKSMIDDVMGVNDKRHSMESMQAAALADLASKLAKGKTKQSKKLVDQLLDKGVFTKGRSDDPNLNLTLLILDIFKMLDTDGSKQIEFNEVEQLMMVIGDKLGVTAEELMEQADADGDGGIDPKELVRWFKKRGEKVEQLRKLREIIAEGIEGAVERYRKTKELLQSLTGNSGMAGVITAGQKDAADLLAYKLKRGKKKASKDLLHALGLDDGDQFARLMDHNRNAANQALLDKLARAKKSKQVKGLLDNIFDTDDMSYLLAKRRGDADADLLSKLARGKSKKSKDLMRKLLEDGAHYMPSNEDLGLLITLLVVDIFHLLDADGSKSLERPELQHFVNVCGEKLRITVNSLLEQADSSGDGEVSAKELTKWFKKRGTTLEELREVQKLISSAVKTMESDKMKKKVKGTAEGIQKIFEDDSFLLDMLRRLGLDPETLRVLANWLMENKKRTQALVEVARLVLGKYERIQKDGTRPKDAMAIVEEHEMKASELASLIVSSGHDVLMTVEKHEALDEAARAIVKSKILRASKTEEACEDLLRYISGDHIVMKTAIKSHGSSGKIKKILLAIQSQCREKQRACRLLLAHKIVLQKIILKIVGTPNLRSGYCAKLLSRMEQYAKTAEDLTTIIDVNVAKLVSCLDAGNLGFHSTIFKLKSDEDEARWHAISELYKVIKADTFVLKDNGGELDRKIQALQKKVFAVSQLLVQITQDDEKLEETWNKLQEAGHLDPNEVQDLMKTLGFLPVKKDAVQRFLKSMSGEEMAHASLGNPAELIAILRARIQTTNDKNASDLLRQMLGDEDLLGNLLKNAQNNSDDWLARKLRKGKQKRSSDLLKDLIGEDWLEGYLNKERLAAEEELRLKLLRKSKKTIENDVSKNPSAALEAATKDFLAHKAAMEHRKLSKKDRMLNELAGGGSELLLDEEKDDDDDDLWDMDIDDLREDFIQDLEVLFDLADEGMKGYLRPEQLQMFLKEHLQRDVELRLVTDAARLMTPKPHDRITKEFFLSVVQAVELLEKRARNAHWDLSFLDTGSKETLPLGCLEQRSSEALWAMNRIERAQPGLKSVAKSLKVNKRGRALKIAWPDIYSNIVTSRPIVKRFYYEGDYEPDLS